MSNLFISHSSRDNAAAKELQARLEEQGHRSVFLDLDPETGIQAGVSWERTLYTKLRACRAVVALCSESYLASQWCFAEIALARMEGKELFVLQIDPWHERTRMPSILSEEQFIDLRTNRDEGYQRLWNGFKVRGIVPEEHRQWSPDDPPYPGLRAFDEVDAPIFFGREAEVREGVELLNRVRRQGHPRMVMVLGSSGSGKSSLARAGLLPRVRRDAHRWLVVGPFRPGRQPARKLAEALSQEFDRAGRPRPWEPIHRLLTDAAGALSAATPRVGAGGSSVHVDPARRRLMEALSSLAGELTEADAGVARSVRRLEEYLAASKPTPIPPSGDPLPSAGGPLVELASELRLLRGAPEASVLLLVDQFEEVLDRESEGPEDPANRFLGQLREALEADDSPLLALATMRSDYLGTLQRSAPLQGLGFKSLSVGPMSPEGMSEIIEKPALLGQIQLGPGLTERLLRETGSSDALPLLAFTLRALWDRYHDGRLLEMEHYEAIGRLEGAVARVADETLEAALALGEEARLRDAFLSLARPAAERTDWARQPVRWDDLAKAVQPMLQCFIEQRLLVKRGDGTVEVAHEALFRSWKTLRGWLDENAEGLHLRRDIRTEAEKWAAAAEAEKPEYLWRGGRLVRALELRDGGLLALDELEHAFVEASERAERAERDAAEARRKRELRLTRTIAAVVAAGLVIFVGLTIWANGQARIAKAERHAARTTALVEQARGRQQEQLDLALLLSLEVEKRGAALQARRLLSEGFEESSGLEGLLHAHTGDILAVAWSPDGRSLASASRTDPQLMLWDVGGERPVGQPLAGVGSSLWTVTWSPVGRLLAAAGVGGAVLLWDLEGVPGEPRRLVDPDRPAETVYALCFAPDGRRLAAARSDQTVQLWDIASGRPVGPLLEGAQDWVKALAWSPDGTTVAAAGMDKLVRRWDAASGEPIGSPLRGHSEGVMSLDWSPDGRLLASGGLDGTAVIWDPATGERRRRLADSLIGPIASVGWGADSRRLAVGGTGGRVQLWDVAHDRPLGPPAAGQLAPLLSVVWSPNGQRIASGHGPVVVLWRSDGGPALGSSIDLGASEVRNLAMSADGNFLAAVGRDPVSQKLGIRVWDRADGRPRAVLNEIGRGAPALAWQAGTKLAAAGTDRVARLWELPVGRRLEERTTGEGGRIARLAWSDDGRRLAAALRDGNVTFWSWEGGESPVVPEAVSDARVTVLVWSPDGATVAAGLDDGRVRRWDTATALERGEPIAAHDGRITSLAWSPDGQTLATGGEDGTVGLWSAANGEAVEAPLPGHDGRVTNLAWSPDGGTLAVADRAGIRLWDVARRVSWAGPLRGHEDTLTGLLFSADGSILTSVSLDGRLRHWDLDLGSWRERACRIAGRNLTLAEWRRYLPYLNYRKTCEAFPGIEEGGTSS